MTCLMDDTCTSTSRSDCMEAIHQQTSSVVTIEDTTEETTCTSTDSSDQTTLSNNGVCHNVSHTSTSTSTSSSNQNHTNSANTSEQWCSSDECFFPDHQPLATEFRCKVVTYAHRRLAKALPPPLLQQKQKQQQQQQESSTSMTLLTHSALELETLLGEGSFSSVFSIRVRASASVTGLQNYVSTSIEMPPASDLVVKVLRQKLIKNPPMLAACAADLVKEGILLARLSHPHILKVHAWSPNGVDAFANGRHDAFFLILDKLQITLSHKLTKWRRLYAMSRGWSIFQSNKILQEKLQSFEERMQVVDPLMDAIVYLHSQQVLHRDLKPDNIGFTARGVLKVFDFDVARLLPQKDPLATFHMTKRVGSPRYMSPECARGEPYNGKADVYTCALLLHELYSLERPYDNIRSEMHDELVFYQAIRPRLPTSWPKPMRDYLQKAWADDIAERPTMEEFRYMWQTRLKTILLTAKQHKFARRWNKEPKDLPVPPPNKLGKYVPISTIVSDEES